MEVVETLSDEIDRLEAAIEDRAGSLAETQLLMSIPGVSYYSALMIYAELGEISRFSEDKEVVSYVGLNPVIRESGDSRFEGGISKKGSGRVRWILVQCAHVAVHTCNDEYLSRFYERLAERKARRKQSSQQPESCWSQCFICSIERRCMIHQELLRERRLASLTDRKYCGREPLVNLLKSQNYRTAPTA